MRGGKDPPQRGNSVFIPDEATLKYSALGGGDLDVLPSIVESCLPEYPDLCVEGGFEGVVSVVVAIGTDGTVCCASLAPGEPKHPLLVEAATQAIREWVFTPGSRSGERICCVATVPVTFELD